MEMSQGAGRLQKLLLAVLAGLCLSLVLMSTSTAQAQSAEDSIEQLAAGEEVFATSCAGCHGIDGAGTNIGRPLTSIAIQEPDRAVHFASVRDGKGSMPAFGERLSDDEIDSAISYVRLTFVGVEAQSAPADEPAAQDELPVTGSTSALLVVLSATLIVAGFVVFDLRRSLTS